MKKIIKIDGMSCGHCKARVEKVLQELDGVESVKVDLDEKLAEVNLLKEISDDTFKTTIEDAGYEFLSIE